MTRGWIFGKVVPHPFNVSLCHRSDRSRIHLLYTFPWRSTDEHWTGRGSHPKPNNLSEAAVRVEVALERHRVSDDNVRERINGDTQVTCGRESWKMLDFTAPGASFSQSISVALHKYNRVSNRRSTPEKDDCEVASRCLGPTSPSTRFYWLQFIHFHPTSQVYAAAAAAAANQVNDDKHRTSGWATVV